MRIGLAIKAFFNILKNKENADAIENILAGKPETAKMKVPLRSDALTLLAALQREARFIDFIQEPIDSYQDAQIGAAVRDIHRNCAKVIERMFTIQKLQTADEGSQIEVPADFASDRFRLTGKVGEAGPYIGTLQHSGWQASKCELPEWHGDEKTALVIAPAEVEIS